MTGAQELRIRGGKGLGRLGRREVDGFRVNNCC